MGRVNTLLDLREESGVTWRWLKFLGHLVQGYDILLDTEMWRPISVPLASPEVLLEPFKYLGSTDYWFENFFHDSNAIATTERYTSWFDEPVPERGFRAKLASVLSTTRFPEAVGPDRLSASGRIINSGKRLRRIVRRNDSKNDARLLCTPLITCVLQASRLPC